MPVFSPFFSKIGNLITFLLHIMRLFFLFLSALLLSASTLTAQKKSISLEDIWKNNTFRTERLQALHPMSNGTEYAVQNFDRNTREGTVAIYSYESGEKVRTAVSTSAINGLDYFISYEFGPNEEQVLLSTKIEPIYRRSALGQYVVYNTLSRKLTKVADELIQEPTFSPDGKKIAYGRDNNLFILDIEKGVTSQITTNGQKNKIINGITDWVYEEEFAFVRAFDWSADSKHLAYIMFDETAVPEFSMDVYGKGLYQEQQVFKYPKAGEANAKVSVRVFDIEKKQLSLLDFATKDAYYVPRIQWTKDKDVLAVQTLNRHQDVLKLYAFDKTNQKITTLLEERDAAYVDVTDNLTFLEDNSFIWTSEKDGWNHIYHHNADGSVSKQVTSGNWEVTSYYGYDQNTDRIFYQSSENGSINRGVYAIELHGGTKQELAAATGTNSADFSADFTYFINSFSDVNTPWQFTLHSAEKGKKVRTIKDNKALKEVYGDFTISKKEFINIDVNGASLNAYMIKPANFDETMEYPVFMHQYSGPGSQQVKNSWGGSNDYWFQMLAQEGYIVVCVDPRGTGLKGRDFKKVTQKELGKYEVQDQIAAAQELGKRSYIDADRIGIWGWSYGGFMASNCLFQGADTFKMAIAVAPVTSWRFYDTIYTERYMQTPQENPTGYDQNSPLSHVNKLEGDFMLVHGSADDNVHVQNTTRLVEALVQANKQFLYFNYPDKNHGIFGGNTRYHLYSMMTNFIKEKL